MGSSKIRDKNKGGGGGKKKSSKDIERLAPDLEDISQIDGSSVEIFSQVFEAGCLTSQLDSIKTLLQSVPEDKFQIVSIVIVQWYFNCQPNSGIRKVISNSLNQVKVTEFCSLLSEQISVHVKNMIQNQNTSDKYVIHNVLVCVDNFRLGQQRVLSESKTVLAFVLETLENQM